MQKKSMMGCLENLPRLGNRNTTIRSYCIPLGDLVIAVFDDAAEFSDNSEKVTEIAVQTVSYMLRHATRASARTLMSEN